MSGSNSAVECNLAKVDVAGSIPVSRSIKIRPTLRSRALLINPPEPKPKSVCPALWVTVPITGSYFRSHNTLHELRPES